MKKKIVVLSLLVGALTIGTFSLLSSPGFAAAPNTPAPEMMGPPMGPPPEMGCTNRFDLMAKLLGLSADQQKQIKAVLTDNREKTHSVFKELRGNEHQLRKIVMATPFDKNAAQALEVKQAKLRTDLLAGRIEMQKKIEALLTPTQRQMAQTLRQLMHEGHEHHSSRKDFRPMAGPPFLGE